MKTILSLCSALLLGMVAMACSSEEADDAEANNADSASHSSAVLTEAEQRAMTPDQILQALKDGNERFATGNLTQRNYVEQVKATSTGQFPKAVVLSCLDSRIPPELVFDRGIGDIFVGRVAGNFENVDLLGSMEFATKLAGARLVLVLGHTECGAVKGACDMAAIDSRFSNLLTMLTNFKPALEAAASVEGEHNSKNAAYVQAVADANVRQTTKDILAKSDVMRALADSGQLKVVGGMYDIGTGKIEWFEEN